MYVCRSTPRRFGNQDPTSPSRRIVAPHNRTHARPTQDTLEIARLCGGDEKSFIPAHLEPPPVDVLDPGAAGMLSGMPSKRL